jgi:hypothetical protein
VRGRVIAILVALGLLAVGAYFVLPPRDYSDTAKGSSAYVARWRSAFEPLADPESAQARYAEVVARRFDGGDWVFGVCRDSHSHRDGGSVVVKDSTGKVRAFFGHVCGDQWLAHALRDFKTLDEFYRFMEEGNFDYKEYAFP